MSDSPLVYRCSKCDAEYPRHVPKCLQCKLWQTVRAVRRVARAIPGDPRAFAVSPRDVLESFAVGDAEIGDVERLGTGSRELDIVLGGGMAVGAAYMICGDPGAGKSTLMTQVGDSLAQSGKGVLGVTGEETLPQLSERLRRLGRVTHPLHRMARANFLPDIEELVIRERPTLLIVDSLQTLYDEGGQGAEKDKRCCGRIVRLAKEQGFTLFLVCHINKKGEASGPKFAEHMVDCVLKLGHPNPKKKSDARSLTIPGKNRYGSATEVGVFTMTATGIVGKRDVAPESAAATPLEQ